jgi:hypothetical protein
MKTNMNRPAHPPFFVVGAQRSGTTMLRLMLNKHPELCVPFESGFIVDFYRNRGVYGDLSQRANAQRLLRDIAEHPLVRKGRLVADSEAILQHPVATYPQLVDAIFTTYARGRNKSRWGDKTPSYVTDLDVLRAIFPSCKIIHLVRDGRDVALSNRNVGWGIHNLPRVAADWRWKTLIAHKIGSVLGNDYLLVRYEDLVPEAAATLSCITRFLGVAYDDAMLSYPASGRSEMPPESLGWHGNSIRAPDVALVDQWKRAMQPADRIIFEQRAGDALATFGYDVENHPSTFGSRLRNLYFATVERW